MGLLGNRKEGAAVSMAWRVLDMHSLSFQVLLVQEMNGPRAVKTIVVGTVEDALQRYMRETVDGANVRVAQVQAELEGLRSTIHRLRRPAVICRTRKTWPCREQNRPRRK
ncbi:hypothetical protein SAMN00790413_03681 [Deinococcus hopiensis KR-140]|uniref:Uncharacterized protein n=1 Tax=Deinococcus hopiensis KR-140 TaxID=695939 RepID=A0A1W1UYL8_9DEIO|nr:hypothetical protein SAMN00790413_03681 [Deinococcus hopiensis KR-140]